MADQNQINLELQNGAKIAVVGGGPSGSFFTYFALQQAKRFDLEISIDIIEAKDFQCAGPAGCNHCGGIVSESLIQHLSAEGIVLPPEVIRKGIESYTLHMEQGHTEIVAEFREQRIASMFRGIGPKGAKPNGKLSFDDYLLDLCRSMGANIILDKVTEVSRVKDGVIITTKEGREEKYDFVVGAVGLNQKTFQLFKKICPSFIVPKTTKTHISELKIPGGKINEYFGNSMHVFLLDLPNIKFGALIPKGEYVTLVLLGKDINREIASRFLQTDTVKQCFPKDMEVESIIACQCYPYINVKGARLAYADRVVLIGDSSTSKLYKNGIGAAYMTAKAAANTAIFHGISEKDFKKHFLPTCKLLERDNSIGKFIFAITSIIQKTPPLKRAMLKILEKEQKNEGTEKNLSSVLWDTFTGSANYSNVLKRFLKPGLLLSIVYLSFINLFISNKTKKQHEIQAE